MRLKNTLSLAISTLIAATSLSALAQGQGSFEGQLVEKRESWHTEQFLHYSNDPAASIGYFLNDDILIKFGYERLHQVYTNHQSGNHEVHGWNASLATQYNFGQAGVDSLRPYLEAGIVQNSITINGDMAHDEAVSISVGAGVKYYFTNNLFALAGVGADYFTERPYSKPNDRTNYSAQIGLGVNLGGNAGRSLVK